MTPRAQPHLVAGEWRSGGGAVFRSFDPASGEVTWEGAAAAEGEVEAAVGAARKAQPDWARSPVEDRIARLEAFADRLEARRGEFAAALSEEIGKPAWESGTEIDAMKSKIRFSIRAREERRSPRVRTADGITSATRFKPHGVVAVLGPFNLPGHLPNAHVVPALLAGNAVVFKPSERAPRAGELLAECWSEAGLPAGAFNLVQGTRETGAALVNHPDIDGIFFTGGFEAGRAIARARADTPQVIVALEMGGNNPLVVWEPIDPDAAVYYALLSAFITAGQRCTCARRLVVPKGAPGEAFLDRLVAAAANLVVGPPRQEPEPFFGPVISQEAADELLAAQDRLRRSGARALLEMERDERRPALVSAGILDVTAATDRPDGEFFGPLLQVIRVPDFDGALAEANATAFGLSAGLLCEDRSLWDRFHRDSRAGIVNWNRAITGASGDQPFGGVGNSGNHRPSGYHAIDSCSWPVASTEAESLRLPEKRPPGLSLK